MKFQSLDRRQCTACGRAVAVVALAVIVVGFALTGCRLQAADPPPAARGVDDMKETITFEGKVVYLRFEGGFWGIVSDDGRSYDPGGLAPEFQVEGLRVRVKAEPLKDAVSFRMWGALVRIIAIERLADTDP